MRRRRYYPLETSLPPRRKRPPCPSGSRSTLQVDFCPSSPWSILRFGFCPSPSLECALCPSSLLLARQFALYRSSLLGSELGSCPLSLCACLSEPHLSSPLCLWLCDRLP